MLIFSYRLLQLVFFPVILIIGLIRIFNKKENFFSYKQKIFANQNYTQIRQSDFLIHFASIGELNSIKFLVDSLNNKKIVLSCSTLSSFELSKKIIPQPYLYISSFRFFLECKYFLIKNKF